MTGSNKLTKADYTKTTLRAYFLQNGFNYTNYQGLGYALVMYPAFKKLYGDDKERFAKELENNSEFYNTNPNFLPFITSIHLAMADKGYDYESIRGIKMALMGPLAGIGDSFFWGTFRIIGAGIGASLAAKGSIMGAVLFLLIYNIPHLIVRYQGLKLGYKSGVSFLESLSKGGVIALLTEVAKILGLVVVGSMCGSMVSLSTPLVLKISGAKIVFQEVFDGIIKGLLPLGFTWLLYKLLQKGFKTTTLLWGILVLGIIGAVAGIF